MNSVVHFHFLFEFELSVCFAPDYAARNMKLHQAQLKTESFQLTDEISRQGRIEIVVFPIGYSGIFKSTASRLAHRMKTLSSGTQAKRAKHIRNQN